jgi:hypothetical protein
MFHPEDKKIINASFWITGTNSIANAKRVILKQSAGRGQRFFR